MNGSAMERSTTSRALVIHRHPAIRHPDQESGGHGRGAPVAARKQRERGTEKKKLLQIVFAVIQASAVGGALLFRDGAFIANRRSRSVLRGKREFAIITSSLTYEKFRMTFRLRRPSFAKIVEMIRAGVHRN